MNLFAGGAVVDGVLHFEEMAVPLPDAIGAQVDAGQRLILGVHAEAASLVYGDRPAPEGIHLRGLVEIIEPDFGHRLQMVYVRTGKFAYAVSGPLDPALDIGAEVSVVFPTDRLYFFDGESERRIG
jgi:hypothetical protein